MSTAYLDFFSPSSSVESWYSGKCNVEALFVVCGLLVMSEIYFCKLIRCLLIQHTLDKPLSHFHI